MQTCRLALILVVIATAGWSVAGCSASAAGPAPRDPSSVNPVAEAQAIVDEASRKRMPMDQAVPPSSMVEVVEILRHDESTRFQGARTYLEGIDSVDSLAVRATLEAFWADGQRLVAELAEEHAKRHDSQVAMLEKTLAVQPAQPDLTTRLEAARQEARDQRRLAKALSTLSDSHSEAGRILAEEVVRRSPQHADGYIALANLHRLRGDWNAFESNLGKAEARGGDRAALRYARAMEQAERLGDRAGARRALEALLVDHADLARARAQLVLLEEDIDNRYQQLQKLKGINPHHALIVLEGHALERDYETAKALRDARASNAPVVR